MRRRSIVNIVASCWLLSSAVAFTQPAYAQADTDWMLGNWHGTLTVPGFAVPPSNSNVLFMRSGNEIRGMRVASDGSKTNLVRGMTDNFGVTSWEVWVSPGGTCPSRWLAGSGYVSFAPDHSSMTIDTPIEQSTCTVGSAYLKTVLTR